MRRRPTLTPQEKEECKRLKTAWLQWQRAHPGHSQAWLADQLGMNQSAISHYLTGRNALNAALLVKIKKVIGVDPGEISKRIAQELSPVIQVPAGSLTVAERDLIEYIKAHGGSVGGRDSVARQLLIAARAFLDKPVADEIVERAGFNAAKPRQPAKK